jgi:hypothetical protein
MVTVQMGHIVQSDMNMSFTFSIRHICSSIMFPYLKLWKYANYCTVNSTPIIEQFSTEPKNSACLFVNIKELVQMVS